LLTFVYIVPIYKHIFYGILVYTLSYLQCLSTTNNIFYTDFTGM
jgi:hypothetical protein